MKILKRYQMELFKHYYKIILFFFFISVGFGFQQNKEEISLIGKEAPGIYLFTLEGEEFFLSDVLNKKKYVFINFFATWCSPCIEELPDLIELHKESKDKVEMIIIDVNNLSPLNPETKVPELKEEDIEEVAKALKDIDFIKLYDIYARTADDFNISQNPVLPQSFLISEDGVVIWEFRGRLKPNNIEDLKQMIGGKN
ncbi:MAG: hypothetical protein CMG62_10370 [Candidatus Marinimicrobia bacterium]|nr:hypothetical protein [Candidatus Neomarinimicrobiota bacterium]